MEPAYWRLARDDPCLVSPAGARRLWMLALLLPLLLFLVAGGLLEEAGRTGRAGAEDTRMIELNALTLSISSARFGLIARSSSDA